ncbi:hypothetical protein LCGC14_2895920 [marine sediment metagenome]|uniref:Uncharacterized protein n=1 Tax=marine sediment metagenome TaxID=412755 RepID=A0A0F8XW79_9ZZZZ
MEMSTKYAKYYALLSVYPANFKAFTEGYIVPVKPKSFVRVDPAIIESERQLNLIKNTATNLGL